MAPLGGESIDALKKSVAQQREGKQAVALELVELTRSIVWEVTPLNSTSKYFFCVFACKLRLEIYCFKKNRVLRWYINKMAGKKKEVSLQVSRSNIAFYIRDPSWV